MRPIMGGQRGGSIYDFFDAMMRMKKIERELMQADEERTRMREHAEDRPSEVRRRAYQDLAAALDAIGTVPEGQKADLMRQAGFTPEELAKFRTPERRTLERTAAGRLADEIIKQQEQEGKTEEDIQAGLKSKDPRARITPQQAEQFRQRFREQMGTRFGAERFAFSRDLPEGTLNQLMREAETRRGIGRLSQTAPVPEAPPQERDLFSLPLILEWLKRQSRQSTDPLAQSFRGHTPPYGPQME